MVAALFARIWAHTFGVQPVWDLMVMAVPVGNYVINRIS
jgi:hypothetical protein